MKRLLRFAVTLLALGMLPLHAAPLSGTKSVGPTGDYLSLTAAIADVQVVGNGLGGALVLELQAAYDGAVETFPLTIPALNGASAVNTVTIRPASGATGRSITSANTTAATVDLSGAKFVRIDGRAGGAGTAKQLTIGNTSTSGVAVRFINEASGNTLRHLTLQGVNTSANSGTVVFSTTTGANGNDNNTIDTCDIRDGASTPRNGIYSLGTTTDAAQNNSGNTVSNCNVFNFYAATSGDSAGVRLDQGNTAWTIDGNSFYQTASRTTVSGSVRPIYVSNSGDSFIVTGNFIGGSAPSAGGAAWTTTGAGGYRFAGIEISTLSTTPSSLQGNTIANMTWRSGSASSALPGVWCGIYAQLNSPSGSVTGNTVGSGTGTGSVSVTTSGNGGTSFGIGSSGVATISENTIGSITTNGTSTAVSASLVGIQVGGKHTISGNTIGSTTTANSLNAATTSVSPTFGQQVTGILNPSFDFAVITGNTVANLNNNYAGTAATGQLRGIATSAGVNTITGNTIHNLSTASANAGQGASSAVLGISQSATASSGQYVSQNTVHSLANTAVSGVVSVSGIYFTGPASGTNVIARNLVHSLAVSATNARLYGMHLAAGTFTAENNMVRVGLNADGASTAENAAAVEGIYDNGTTAGRNFYHNSVFLGGTHTLSNARPVAFRSIGNSNARTFQNNIIVNARSHSGANNSYSILYDSPGLSGLTAGGNLFFASGTRAVLGSYHLAVCPILTDWQAATGQDTTSAVGNPRFVNPTGTAATVDLHLQSSNPAEGQGLPLASVTDDFDGQTRSTLTPVDIGADAGNFIWIDSTAPLISHQLLTNGSVANRVLTDWVSIVDNVGVASGANAPRLYYKKSADADAFGVANDSTGNGWKYVTATGNGPYSFTIDYTLLNGGSVTEGDIIQYFVVVQDAANNLASSPAGVTASANPPVQNVAGHGAVNSYSIVPGISGIVTVGSGGTYPSLSGAGGLFFMLNGSVLTGNVIVNLTSDLTETGGVTLNQWHEEGVGNYTLTFQPNSATMRTISGSAANGLVTLNGADRVIIDGRFGGSGRYLTFRNTDSGTDANTFLFLNDASSNTVRHCIVEGAGAGSGVIYFSSGTVTGNDENVITGCQVRDLTTTAGVPRYLINSSGTFNGGSNSNNTVANNELFNFNTAGIRIFWLGNDSWTIDGNDIYEVNAAASDNYGILFGCSGTNSITGNSIYGLRTSGNSSIGISFGGIFDGNSITTIARNRITSLDVNAGTTTIIGILAESDNGTLNVVNNQVTLSPAASGSMSLYGLYDTSSSNSSVVNVFYNSVVLGGMESSALNSWTSFRRSGTFGSTHTARGNIFLNLRTGGSASHFAAGSEGDSDGYTASHNFYAGTGAGGSANFMDFSTTGSTVPVNFALWQSATGETNSQGDVAGSGSFTAAMFVNAAAGDLHLVPGGDALVNALGTPIAGVTNDFDGYPRSATTPTIGSDEISAYSTWATTAGVSIDPNALGANGVKNLLNFAFSIDPVTGGSGELQYAGTLVGGGTITATGFPRPWVEPSGNGVDFRALFVRRKNYAAEGVTYTPQFSPDLVNWQNSGAVPMVLADDGTNQIVSVPYPPLAGGINAQFFKLSVTIVP
jgi:hypothetical protein